MTTGTPSFVQACKIYMKSCMGLDNVNHDWWGGGLGEMTSSHVFEIVGQDGSEGHTSTIIVH